MAFYLLPDQQLYTNYHHYRSTFRWRTGSTPSSDRLLYHAYWSGPLNRHHELCVKSLLVTQSSPFEVWIWMSPEDLSRNAPIVASWARSTMVRFREYVPEREAADTPLEGQLALLEGRIPPPDKRWQPGGPRAVSDALRLLVLWKYGGVYFDLDNLFLRDLRPLCEVSFVYQWSNQPVANNAVSHFPRGSRVLAALAARAIALRSCHQMVLLRLDEVAALPGDTLVLPSFVFDPAWIARDTKTPVNDYCGEFDEFFSRSVPMTMAEFFPGSYAYHWHRRWDQPIRPDAIAGQLHAEVSAAFSARFESGHGPA